VDLDVLAAARVVIGTILWIALALGALVIELRARRGRGATVGALASWVSRTRFGRLVLIAVWAFVGLHLFARYTIPR
jgi:hypothetical protein